MENIQNNIFFKLNHLYIIVLNPIINVKYDFIYIKNNYYLNLKKLNNQPITIHLKIINEHHKCCYISLKNQQDSFIKISINQETFNNHHKDSIIIFDLNFLKKKFKFFNVELYNQNLFHLELNEFNIHFLYLNWYYFGQYNSYQYWKYILYKNKLLFNSLFKNINYKLSYSKNNKYSLVFIDDRFDPIFEYILIMFLYGVNHTWNLNIFTIEEHFNTYKNICNKLNVDCQLNKINKMKNIDEYSTLLKTYDFWNYFHEDYVLIFQYDSCCFKKLTESFLNYNYIGAQWPPHMRRFKKKNICNGNGGTSYRCVKDMKYITLKYNHLLYDEFLPEDLYFSKYLHLENRLMNNPDVCNQFSIENVFYDNSIFGHQIYQCINLNELEHFIVNRLNKLSK